MHRVDEIAKEVFRKPMSYLTKAHDQEIIDLQNLIAELEAEEKRNKELEDVEKNKAKQVSTLVSMEMIGQVTNEETIENYAEDS